MYRNDAQKSINTARIRINTARKSLKEARINSNSHAESKNFLGTLCLWIGVLRVQSRKNNSENLTIFRGEFKTENFKKIRKNEVF